MSSPSDAQSSPHILCLPYTMKSWPWPRAINPYHEEVALESNAWLKSFKPFNERSQYAFDNCDLELLRTGLIFFVIDEYTDVEPMHVVREMVDVVIDALRNPHKPRPEGEIVLGEMTRQSRGSRSVTPEAARRMFESSTDYLKSLVVQAGDRVNDTLRTVESYMHIQREKNGARPSYVPGELHLSIPDNAFYDPVDIASYNKEQAVGNDCYNILTIVMRQFDLLLSEAVEWVAKYHKKIEERFLDGLDRTPSWDKEIDDQVAVYIKVIANWPRGNSCWSFEAGRYFGSKELKIQKRKRATGLHKEEVVVPMVDDM
ncbi:isoprenoid synthase domain-containing protein [Cytidiella melzeri]|nr:isoprenoid synthase domain-containing protein [Cytidiella melzeri]